MTDRWVHRCTNTYRALVDAMSYPGEILDVSYHDSEDMNTYGIATPILLLAMTLLDGEVSFCVIGKQADRVAQVICKMTSAKQANISCADYVFIMSHLDDSQCQYVVENIKTGSLIDPHLSATIFYTLKDITKGDKYLLKGPGIKTQNSANLSDMSTFIKYRNQCVEEFPLGFDAFFVTSSGQLFALPRTTRIEEA